MSDNKIRNEEEFKKLIKKKREETEALRKMLRNLNSMNKHKK